MDLAGRRGKLEGAEGSVLVLELENWVSERMGRGRAEKGVRGLRWVLVHEPCRATDPEIHCCRPFKAQKDKEKGLYLVGYLFLQYTFCKESSKFR